VFQLSSDGQPEQVLEKTIDLFLDGQNQVSGKRVLGQTNERQRYFND
jgi:hypothetical protein